MQKKCLLYRNAQARQYSRRFANKWSTWNHDCSASTTFLKFLQTQTLLCLFQLFLSGFFANSVVTESRSCDHGSSSLSTLALVAGTVDRSRPIGIGRLTCVIFTDLWVIDCCVQLRHTGNNPGWREIQSAGESSGETAKYLLQRFSSSKAFQ